MRYYGYILATFFALSVATHAPAAEPPTNKILHEVLPYVDQDIHLLAWSDLTKIDGSAMVQFLFAIAGQQIEPAIVSQEAKPIDGIKAALRAAGCEHIYLIGSLPELVTGGLVIVFPCTNPAAVKAIVESLPLPLPPMEYRIDGNVLLYGADVRLNAAVKHPNAPSTQISQALQHASAASPQGIVVAPPRNLDDLLQLALPDDVPDVQAFKRLAAAGNDLQWALLSGKLPPSDMQLTVTMQDPQAAEKLDQTLQDIVKQADRKFAPQTIAYSREGSRLIKRLADQAEAVAILQDIRGNALADSSTDWQTANNMKQVAIALHNYHEAHGQFPPQALTDANGRRLLSWRVLILPYLEQQALYQQFHLDEPWDSPHNLKWAETIPAPYAANNQALLKPGYTRIVALLTKDSVFGHVGGPMRFQNIIDGTVNTVWFAQSLTDAAVPWSQPVDWDVDQAAYQAWLPKPDAAELVAFVDGSVQVISGKIHWETFQKFLTIGGGEIVDRDLNP